MDKQQQSVLSALMEGDESTRLTTAGDLLFQAESYARLLKQALSGVAGRMLDRPEEYRDLYAISGMADELAAWLKGHYTPIYERAGVLQAAEPPAVEQPAIFNVAGTPTRH